MDVRQISPTYSVSPQIQASDVATLREAGFVGIICNRPDAENPPSSQADQIAAAAKAAGLSFTYNPVTHQTLNMDMVAAQNDAMENAAGPVLAYCASGTRSSIVWSLGQAGRMPTDDIIGATTSAGYDLSGMRNQLDHIAAQG